MTNEAMARALGMTQHRYRLGSDHYDEDWILASGAVYGDELPDFAALRQPGDTDTEWTARCRARIAADMAEMPFGLSIR